MVLETFLWDSNAASIPLFRADPPIDIIPIENGLSRYELAAADKFDSGRAQAPDRI